MPVAVYLLACVCLDPAGINAPYLLALAAAHGSTDVVSVLLEPPIWLRTVLAVSW